MLWLASNRCCGLGTLALAAIKVLRRSGSGFTTSRSGHRLHKPQLVRFQPAMRRTHFPGQPTTDDAYFSASQDSQTALNAARSGASNVQGSGVEVFGSCLGRLV